MEIKKYLYEIISVFIGATILLTNFFIISHIIPALTPILNIIGALVAIVPSFWIFYSRYVESKEMESQFIVFITDLTEAIDSGMTLPMALKYCGGRDYGVLTPHIKGIASRVDWGVPFREALYIFSKKVGSLPVKRAITTIIETYKVGGKIGETLKTIGTSLIEISKIKAERTLSVQSQIMTSYLIYFIFIFILIVLQSFLLPALSPKEIIGVTSPLGTVPITPTLLSPEIFTNFIIIQGFFAGLATGKMAEGSVVAGLKHSIVLIAIGYTLFSFAAQFQIAF